MLFATGRTESAATRRLNAHFHQNRRKADLGRSRRRARSLRVHQWRGRWRGPSVRPPPDQRARAVHPDPGLSSLLSSPISFIAAASSVPAMSTSRLRLALQRRPGPQGPDGPRRGGGFRGPARHGVAGVGGARPRLSTGPSIATDSSPFAMLDIIVVFSFRTNKCLEKPGAARGQSG